MSVSPRHSPQVSSHDSHPKERILIIEDETAMRRGLEDCLDNAGYRVLSASEGAAGLARALKEKPDLILLDIMLPGLDGFAVCRELRRMGVDASILMLSAKGQGRDRVQGLDLGADDYLAKPFLAEELLARVRALLRRHQRVQARGSVLTMGPLSLDWGRQVVKKSGKELRLTSKEFAMLRLLAESQGGVVSRERFLDVVWGYAAFPTTRTVDNHVASLRSKLQIKPGEPGWIETVHGAGYRWWGVSAQT